MKSSVKKLFGAVTALFLLVSMLPCNAFAADEAGVSGISWSGTKVVEKESEYVFEIGTAVAVGRFQIAETENVLVSTKVYLPENGELTIETAKDGDVLATAKLSGKKVHVSGDIKREGFGAYEESKWVDVKLLQNTESGEYNVYIDDKAILLLEAQGKAGLPNAVRLTAGSSSAYAKDVTVSKYIPVENKVRTIYERDEKTLNPRSENNTAVPDSYFFYAGADVNTKIENAEHVRISFDAVQTDSSSESSTGAFWVGLVEDDKMSNPGTVRSSSQGAIFQLDGNGKFTKNDASTSQIITDLSFSTKDTTKANYVIDICADKTETNKATVTVRVGDEIGVTSFVCGNTVTLRDCRNLVFQVKGKATTKNFDFTNIKAEVISSASAVYFEDFEDTDVDTEPESFKKYSTQSQVNETFKVVDGSKMVTYTEQETSTPVTGNSTKVAEFYQPQYTDSDTKRTKDGGIVEDNTVNKLDKGVSETVYVELPNEMKKAEKLRLSFNVYNPMNSINTKSNANGKFNQMLRIGFHNEKGSDMATNRTDSVIFGLSAHSVVSGTDQKQQFDVQGISNTLAGFNTLTWGNLTMEINRYSNENNENRYKVTAYGRGTVATCEEAKIKQDNNTYKYVTDDMNYVMMQIPYNTGGKYYLDNLLIENVCDADAFVGETILLAKGVSYGVKEVAKNESDSNTIASVTVMKTGELSNGTKPTLYFAVYDANGSLSSVVTDDLSTDFEGATKTISVNKTLATGQYYRIFIFDQGLVPMMTAYSEQ